MDLQTEKTLKIIFPDGVPDHLQTTPELLSYLAKLGTYKMEQLKKEQSRLREESRVFEERMEDLAISKYKTFIHTAEISRSVFQEFLQTESEVGTLLEKLPALKETCEDFLKKSGDINETYRLNTIALHKDTQLLEILEIPKLMNYCLRENSYEESLELADYVHKMGQNHGRVLVINNIVKTVEAFWHTMLCSLIDQLGMDLQLPRCLQIIGYLRQMRAFDDKQLKLKFLQARGSWLAKSLEEIPKDDAKQHLIKTIEFTRTSLFNITTQYRAIFSEENVSSVDILKARESVACDDKNVYLAWLHLKIDKFLEILSKDLQLVNSFDTLLGQSMYFGLSFSRSGMDFRGLITPVFITAIKRNFENTVAEVTQKFQSSLENYTLSNVVALHSQRLGMSIEATVEEEDKLLPPEYLLDFVPLAFACNGYLNALNDFRLCAPIALANDITQILQKSLESIASMISLFYKQEHQAFSNTESEFFLKFCACFAYDLISYIQRCIHAVFPPQKLATYLGVSLLTLEQEKLTYLEQTCIIEPLKPMLLNKFDD